MASEAGGDAFERVLLESLTDGVAAIDAQGNVRIWNAEIEAITGVAADSVRGGPCPIEPLAAALGRTREEGLPVEEFWTLTRRDGQEVAVEGRVVPVRDDAGAILGALAVLREVHPFSTAECLRRLAGTDPLTGLANRRELEYFLAARQGPGKLASRFLSVILADLDGLKRLNDTRGHAEGDQALRRAAAVLRDGCRAGDLVVRYGGDEFLVVLPGAQLPAALAAAERLRRALDQAGLPASLGVGSLSAGQSATELIARADEALYRAKRAGGNRVEPQT